MPLGINGFGMFDFLFVIVPVMVIILFIAVLAIMGVTILKSVRQRSYNRSQPLLTVRAKVVAKRSEVRHHHHTSDFHHYPNASRTCYYATFEVERGDRMELSIPDAEIGYLVEGDEGALTFQGTDYKRFVRL